MSQAQPQPRLPLRRSGRTPRRRPRVVGGGTETRGGTSDPGTEANNPSKSTTVGPRRRTPLLTFLLGLGLGYGLTGPIPTVFNGAMALLRHGPGLVGEMASPLAGIGNTQILVMGVDQVGDNTDVIFTVAVQDGATTLLQVPRDTFIESERFGVLKANALYAYGGMDAAKHELSDLLNAPIKRHLKLNLRAVERVAEALGGIEVDVPRRMYYVDYSQDLYIDLYPGRQLLKGPDLIGYLRFRNDEMGDIGRMERQREVFQKVFSKLIHPTTLARLPELLQIAGEDIDTDLTPVEFGQLLAAMTRTNLTASQMPGRLFWHDDLSYWMPDSNTNYSSEPVAESTGESHVGEQGRVDEDANEDLRTYY
jgi:polyisoprenyl-teichoic acid--peptidoglycan teichoic acid transferase